MLARRWIDWLLVAVVAVVLYHSALGIHGRTQFTYDDGPIVAQNQRLDVEGWDDAVELIRSKYWGDGFAAERLWRPLPMLTYAFDVATSGRDPDGFHRTNVLLYVGLCLVVLGLFRRLLRARSVALAGALLFAAHPIHAESVAGVVGRAEVLALLGVASGTLLHLWARGGRLWAYPLAAACFLLGFLSKESALTGPFVLALVEVAARGQRSQSASRARRALRLLAPYLLYGGALAAYFALRWLVLGEVFATEGARTLGDMPLAQRLVVAALTTRDTLVCLVVPPVTSAHYELPFSVAQGPPAWLSPEVILTCALHAAVLGAGLWALSRRAPIWRSVGLGVGGVYLAFGPASNVIPIGVVFADRLLFAPSLWAALALAGGLRLAARGRQPFALVLAVVLFGFGVRTGTNARAWTQERLLWEVSQEQFPESPRIAVALGFYQVRDRPDEARRNFELAIAGFDPPERWSRLAAQARAGLALCVEREDPGRARDLLETAFQIDATVPAVALGLSQVYVALAQQARDPAERASYLRRAEQAARHGTRVAPRDYDLWVRLGSVLNYLERWREAEAAFTRAIERRPSPWQARFGRALARHEAYVPPHLPNEPGAVEDYRVVIELLTPGFERGALSGEQQRVLADALLKGGALAGKLGRRATAVQWLSALQQAYPEHEARKVRLLLELFRGS